MKKEDVPQFSYRKLKDNEHDENEIEIEGNKHLFSNIDKISIDNCYLTIKQGYQLHVSQPLKYVCLQIDNNLESNDMNISKLEPIKKILNNAM